MIKVIAGKYKSRKLLQVPKTNVRPTQAVVRKSMFDILGDLTGFNVLDLYSGVGTLGIESISRGATSLVSVEKDKFTHRILKENLDMICMDDDTIRRGKPSTHVKFGEATAVLAGNSLLTMAFEILSHKDLRISEKIKIDLINKISESSGHLGIAGGQYLDLNYERKKISQKKIEEMEIKKTGKLFSFCCAAPLIIKKKNKSDIKKFENIGADIGLLFQVADDLIDYKGSLLVAGKKTGKDKKKGKATLISLLGYKNTIKYANNLILRIKSKLKKYGSKSRNLSETLNYILNRNK